MSRKMPWLRLYTEIIDDEKLGLLAFEDRWHFVALLCLKGKGVLDSEPDAEMLHRKVAYKLGLTCAELEKVAARIARMGLIDAQTFQPTAWDDRQFDTDRDPTNAERQKRFRDKKPTVTPRNALITVLDTDTDTDTDKSSSHASEATALPRSDDEKPNSPAQWIGVFAEQHGVDVDHRSFHDRKKFWPLAQAWTNAGVTVGQMRAACAKAHADATEPIAWLPAYADRVLASMQSAKQPAKATEPEWRTEQRNRTLKAVPSIAEKHPSKPLSAHEFFDLEAKNVTAIALG